MEELEHSYIASRNVNGIATLENSLAFFFQSEKYS